MLPGNELSEATGERPYLWRDAAGAVALTTLETFERGGVALGDASLGQLVQPWKAFIKNQREVWLSSANHAESMLFSRTYPITELSLAFDQNMRPLVAFVEAGVAAFWWYDAVVEAQIFSFIGEGVTNPRCTLDDKRPMQAQQASIILAYIRAGGLYYRDQIDRFQIEYLLSPTVPGELLELGMNTGYRLQFKFGNRMTYEELISLYASNADHADITHNNQTPSAVSVYNPDGDIWKPGRNT